MADPASGVISDDDDLERAIQADGMDMESDSDIRVQNPASKIEEWTLLLRFVTKGSDSTVNIVKIHRDIFRLIKQSDDKFAVKTLQGTLIDSASEFPTGADYQAQFQTQETKNQFVVAHSVYSSKALDAIKRNNPALLELSSLTCQLPDPSLWSSSEQSSGSTRTIPPKSSSMQTC